MVHYALIILLAWGVQAYFMKLANGTMNAENIFFYMTLTGLLLIPVALWMTDFSVPIEYGWSGPGLGRDHANSQCRGRVDAGLRVSLWQSPRGGRRSPTAGAPLITAIVTMMVLGVMPNTITLAGIVLAFIAAALLCHRTGREVPHCPRAPR